MDYYHDMVTQKSWEELIRLCRIVPCVLIGGWAVYLYAKRLKSKDIDILVDFDALSILKHRYTINRHDRLKKYHAVRDVVDIDIYLPYYSRIGIPVEDLIGKTRVIEGFTVIDANYLFALKLYTLGERGRMPKGRKDFLDILSLFVSNQVDAKETLRILSQYRLNETLEKFHTFLLESRDVPELDLSIHGYAALKKSIIQVFSLRTP